MVKPGVSVYFKDRHLETAFFLGKEIRIGRLRDNEVVLDNIGVSRHHSRIFVEGDNYVLEDMKSANGTRVNGALVDRVCLSYGDQITIAKFTLVFQLLDTQSIRQTRQPIKPPVGDDRSAADQTTLYTGDRIDLEPLGTGRNQAAREATARAVTGGPAVPPGLDERTRRMGIRGAVTPVIPDEDSTARKAAAAAVQRKAAPPGYYALLIFKEGEKLAQKPLDRRSFSIGRSSDNDLILSGPEISRYHATITQSEGCYQIEDMASRNGIHVNGVAVNRQFLSPGDEIVVGKYRVVFVRGDAPPIEKIYRDGAVKELSGVDEAGKTQALDAFARELMSMTDRIAVQAMTIEVKEPTGAPAPDNRDVALFHALEAVEMSLNYKGWVLDQSWPVEVSLTGAAPGAAPNTIKIRLIFPTYSAEVELPLNKMRKVQK